MGRRGPRGVPDLWGRFAANIYFRETGDELLSVDFYCLLTSCVFPEIKYVERER